MTLRKSGSRLIASLDKEPPNDVVRESETQIRDREILQRLRALLSLSCDEMGLLLGVSSETVSRWEGGRHRVLDEHMAQLDHTEAALGRLLEIFRPERLPRVLRRVADLFSGETALDWILRGRISEVADRYEAAPAHQARRNLPTPPSARDEAVAATRE